MNNDIAILAVWLRACEKLRHLAGQGGMRDFILKDLPLPPALEKHKNDLANLVDGQGEGASILLAASLIVNRMHPTADGQPRMESIFTRVRLGDKKIPPTAPKLHYSFAPITDEDAIFPGISPSGSLASLSDTLLRKLGNLPSLDNTALYLDTVASLMETHLWCVNLGDGISLFDRASIAAALTQIFLFTGDNDAPMLLFGGELSGIQNFIFGQNRDDPDKGAHKLLRARSFLLQTITRSIWLSLLRRLNLGRPARIMDAGGRFTLLLPDTPQCRQQVERLQIDVEKWLLDRFGGAIKMNFGMGEIRPDQLAHAQFVQCFENFNDNLEKSALSPWRHVFSQGSSAVIPLDHAAYAAHGECSMCHANPASAASQENPPICAQCLDLVNRIGARLPRANFVFYGNAPGIPLFDGLHMRLIDKDSPSNEDLDNASEIVSIRSAGLFTFVPVAGQVPVITREDLEQWQKSGIAQFTDGHYYYDGENISAGMPKTFSMLADQARIPTENGWRSIKCLASLKADVDNLGLLFGMGFGHGRDSDFSIARYAMLARMMNYFFSGHLMHLARKKYPDTYVIFAGGDDLFLIGPWWQTIQFATEMHDHFQKFSGGNPAVTISAGLPLLKPHLPMRGIRDEAEENLEKSKKSTGIHPGESKNAATLFGVTAPWPEFDNLLQKGRWLEDLALNDTISQGFIRRMLRYAGDCRQFMEGNLAKGLYLAHLRYDLARNWPENQHSRDRAEIAALGQDKNLFSRARLAISWALYRTRAS